ncbi:hypothetical protein M409DRAFT_59732 [Zasmidium cellare ATCC 36951]|uniref:Uncharacterized protein n=1 Tax=Zasmidium cellare ATCC 36951 TaxID=1080233 RepID=A0A6A6C3C9_ZASCE|nr:uncharacterized protein M409DRAFT_59732 [Zasmidium cellare ATCC 36951]KAF2160700.1 hypothetical protein M409DRAFT_59732 [Zasmidium cellare ATCC 36951]
MVCDRTSPTAHSDWKPTIDCVDGQCAGESVIIYISLWAWRRSPTARSRRSRLRTDDVVGAYPEDGGPTRRDARSLHTTEAACLSGSCALAASSGATRVAAFDESSHTGSVRLLHVAATGTTLMCQSALSEAPARVGCEEENSRDEAVIGRKADNNGLCAPSSIPSNPTCYPGPRPSHRSHDLSARVVCRQGIICDEAVGAGTLSSFALPRTQFLNSSH